MNARTATAAIALALLSAPTAIFAASAKYEPMTVTVEVNDLDPADPADQARYTSRLKAAARKACDLGVNESWARAEEQRCVSEVVTKGGTWAN